MRELSPLLFHVDSLDDFIQQNAAQAIRAVDRIPEQQFTNSSTDNIVDYIFSQFEIIPLDLHEDRKEMETAEVQVDVTGDPSRCFLDETGPHYVRGIRVTVTIPFSGQSSLWKYRTNTFNWNPPRANIRTVGNNEEGGVLEIVIEKPIDVVGDGSNLKDEVNQTLGNINWYLHQSRSQVLGHNQNLRNQIRQAIENRRAQLGKHAEIVKVLNIPLKQRASAPDVTQLTIKRRIIKPLPTKPNAPAEPAISDQEFENILRIIRHEGRTFETTPATYSVHDEEGLRNIILAHLNGHYEGDATGEVFRRVGKTDIRIEDKNRAAFVAECKVWRGQKEITESIDQLLGYLTWRDCRAALVIFNQHVAAFSGIQAKLPNILSEHANYIARMNVNEAGEWRFKFLSREDPNHHIIVHIFLFNLFISKNKAKKGRCGRDL
jgi:hypothetical protein